MLERISVNWERFVESRAREAYTAAMVELGMLAEKHIYPATLLDDCSQSCLGLKTIVYHDVPIMYRVVILNLKSPLYFAQILL